MALAKIVGFEVTPRMPWSTSRCRSPPRRYARFRLSSHGLCPCSSYSCCSLVLAMSKVPSRLKPSSVLFFFELVQQLAGAGGHVVGREAHLLVHLEVRRRRTPMVERQHVVGPPSPAERHTGLDGQGGDVRGQHLLLVVVILFLEQLPGGHGPHAREDAVSRQHVGGTHTEVHLAAGAYEHE